MDTTESMPIKSPSLKNIPINSPSKSPSPLLKSTPHPISPPSQNESLIQPSFESQTEDHVLSSNSKRTRSSSPSPSRSPSQTSVKVYVGSTPKSSIGSRSNLNLGKDSLNRSEDIRNDGPGPYIASLNRVLTRNGLQPKVSVNRESVRKNFGISLFT